MSDLVIRAAVLADEAELADMDRRTWSPDHAVSPPPPPDYVFFDEGHPPHQYLVAIRDGAIVGYIRLVQPIEVPSNAHVRQIQGLVVDFPERGKGTGMALLEAARHEARLAAAHRLTLRVLGVNTVARRLYERAGYVVEGVLPEEFYFGGRYVDDILMGRRTTDY